MQNARHFPVRKIYPTHVRLVSWDRKMLRQSRQCRRATLVRWSPDRPWRMVSVHAGGMRRVGLEQWHNMEQHVRCHAPYVFGAMANTILHLRREVSRLGGKPFPAVSGKHGDSWLYDYADRMFTRGTKYRDRYKRSNAELQKANIRIGELETANNGLAMESHNLRQQLGDMVRDDDSAPAHLAHAQHIIKTQDDQLADMKAELEESTKLTDKLSDLLTRTANALKGEPAPLSSHDWSDLPAFAKAIRAIAESGESNSAKLQKALMTAAERHGDRVGFPAAPGIFPVTIEGERGGAPYKEHTCALWDMRSWKVWNEFLDPPEWDGVEWMNCRVVSWRMP